MLYGIFLSICAALSWGLVYVLEQKVLVQFSVPKFLVFESIFIFIVALPLSLYLGGADSRLSLGDYKVIFAPPFLLLMVATFFGNYFILSSVQKIGATTAAMFEITFPLFVVIFAFYILKQPIHWATLIGGFLILSGSWLIIYFNKL